MKKILGPQKEIIVLLENVRSTHNVGAIFRTCDGAGVKKLFLCGITPYPPHPKLIKTALGAENYVDWKYFPDINEALGEVKNMGFKIFSIEQSEKSISLGNVKSSSKMCLIFGNEISGISPEILRISDNIIELPMFGKKNSLNVATTVGIVTYYFSALNNE